MMSQGAQVGSVEAIEAFRVALANYIDESKQALTMIDLEIRRAVDWVRVDRADYWKHEIRRSGEAVNRGKTICIAALVSRGWRATRRPASTNAKRSSGPKHRLRNAELKAEAVRKWTRAMQHELNEYAGRIVQFNASLDSDIPKALALLGRILDTLDRYRSATAPRPMAESAIARPGSLNEPEAAASEASMARPLDELDPAAKPAEESPEAAAAEAASGAAAETDHGAADSEDHV